MKFAHRYKLLKDIPGYEAGRVVEWSGCHGQRFYFRKPDSIYLDLEGPKFTVEQVQGKEWFAPEGKLVDFIPAFPSRRRLDEYVDLMPSCRLVDDVDQCRAINVLLNDANFQKRLYQFYKGQYEAFHELA